MFVCVFIAPSTLTCPRWRSHLLTASAVTKLLSYPSPYLGSRAPFSEGLRQNRLLQHRRRIGNDTAARVCMNAGTGEYWQKRELREKKKSVTCWARRDELWKGRSVCNCKKGRCVEVVEGREREKGRAAFCLSVFYTGSHMFGDIFITVFNHWLLRPCGFGSIICVNNLGV